jgi:hypothetical protein
VSYLLSVVESTHLGPPRGSHVRRADERALHRLRQRGLQGTLDDAGRLRRRPRWQHYHMRAAVRDGLPEGHAIEHGAINQAVASAAPKRSRVTTSGSELQCLKHEPRVPTASSHQNQNARLFRGLQVPCSLLIRWGLGFKPQTLNPRFLAGSQCAGALSTVKPYTLTWPGKYHH